MLFERVPNQLLAINLYFLAALKGRSCNGSETGCAHWQFKASAEVRTAVVLTLGLLTLP